MACGRGAFSFSSGEKKDNKFPAAVKFTSLKSTITFFDDCVIPICFIGSLVCTLYILHPIFHFFPPFLRCVVCVFVKFMQKQMKIWVKQAFIKRVTFMTVTWSQNWIVKATTGLMNIIWMLKSSFITIILNCCKMIIFRHECQVTSYHKLCTNISQSEIVIQSFHGFQLFAYINFLIDLWCDNQ